MVQRLRSLDGQALQEHHNMLRRLISAYAASVLGALSMFKRADPCRDEAI